MGLENRIVYNLVDVVEGNCRIKQALIKDKRYPNLYLLPSAQTRDKTAVSPEQMVKLIEELSAAGITCNKIFSERPTLNDVFLELTGKELRD